MVPYGILGSMLSKIPSQGGFCVWILDACAYWPCVVWLFSSTRRPPRLFIGSFDVLFLSRRSDGL
ncbi:hypothetical protein CPB83DRAFT_844972 [Crepidotus variabilis]|uniref:Uncharacterized protein n=1 Tax=Crepidotus variabilis TaxID=179855 RepID=A0A9P6JVK9_9AGAR|nr:hypothetical protein CPB83DRAFT_844972 [Crepidotus variabilis]